MYCPNCKQYLEGYRCPKCNIFLLDDPNVKKKKGSLYYREITKSNRRMWPVYLFLLLFCGGWLFVVSYFLSMLK